MNADKSTGSNGSFPDLLRSLPRISHRLIMGQDRASGCNRSVVFDCDFLRVQVVNDYEIAYLRRLRDASSSESVKGAPQRGRRAEPCGQKEQGRTDSNLKRTTGLVGRSPGRRSHAGSRTCLNFQQCLTLRALGVSVRSSPGGKPNGCGDPMRWPDSIRQIAVLSNGIIVPVCVSHSAHNRTELREGGRLSPSVSSFGHGSRRMLARGDLFDPRLAQ